MPRLPLIARKDKPIVDILEYINAIPQFVSSSSCSGRAAVFAEVSTRQQYEPLQVQHLDKRKQTGNWLYSTHERVNQTDLELAVSSDSIQVSVHV